MEPLRHGGLVFLHVNPVELEPDAASGVRGAVCGQARLSGMFVVPDCIITPTARRA